MTKNTIVAVIAHIQILPGFEQELLKAAEEVWLETRKEPGCLEFSFNQANDKSDLYFYEVFKTPADFDFHVAQQHTKKFLAELHGKAVNDGPQLTFLKKFTD